MLQTNQIYLGDCLEKMQEIDDKSIDCIICDLPYGSTQNSWDIIIPFDKLWEQYERIRKDNCVIALFGSEPFSSYLRMSNIKNFRYDWVWHKSKPSGIALAKKQPMRNHEVVSIFYPSNFYAIQEEREGFTEKSKARFASGKNFGSYRNHGESTTGLEKQEELKPISLLRNPTSIKKFASIPNRLGTLHPSQKPIDLLEYLIKTYTQENDLILDNCFGSGSTLVAAKNLNRQFIGIEKNEVYFEIARKRLEL
jgi:site-specific DNA-methyltransferase (adenine-specific)